MLEHLRTSKSCIQSLLLACFPSSIELKLDTNLIPLNSQLHLTEYNPHHPAFPALAK